MNDELRRRVERIRAVLADRDDGIVLGDFPPGRTVEAAGLPPGLAEVVAITEGPRAGDLVLLKADRIGEPEIPLDEVAADVPDPGNWVHVGARNYEPLLANATTGEVWWFPDTGVVWYESHLFEKLADNPADLVLDYLLGDGYLDIAGPDDWSALLVALGWAEDDEDDEPGG
ncbi:hypothetical protein AB0H57_21950 [Micromonospora sp. NPDC050686]|uniref:hypothetical protein n=1 Tax=Micromonospora sp. NPDC050686 TaxID=3154631 RepID=UPI0033E21A03